VTVNRASRRARPRWLTLALLVLCLSALGAGIAVGHGVTSVPARYAGGTQVDIDPPPGPAANDQPGQVDMTQMGRDTSVNPNVRIFWSWDGISLWTGTGQTGDACALFDNDNDGKINYVICARVNNPAADPTVTSLVPAAANKPAYLFDCTDARIDRCSQPTPRTYTAGQVLAGPLAATVNLTQSGAGNLQNETDPFDAAVANGPGEAYPHDSSLEIQVASALVPTGARLANVCSYPSAGNGGNNNPFDCIVTPGVQYGTLRVTKVLTQDNGGNKAFGDFSFTAGSGTSTTGAIAATTFDADGSIDTQVPVGTYSVAEVNTPIAGYSTNYSNCTSINVTAGGTATCTITNNDRAPSLTLVKEVVNDNGGTAVAADWTLTATGYDAASPHAGTYNLSESGGPTGYTRTSLKCSDTGNTQVTSVTLSLGEDVTCTFINDDNAPSLTLVKQVVNDNGGTAVASDWTLTATGYDAASPDAGTYNLSESGGPAGYTRTSLKCSDTGNTQVTSVTLSLGESVTCTFINDDDASGLTLIKHLINDNGGGAAASAWTLNAGSHSVTGSEVGALATSIAGTYALSETGGPTGYSQTSLTCSDTGTAQVSSVTLSLGESVTCTFVNNDNATSLTLIKHVVNDNGDTAVAGAWSLHAGSNVVTGSETGTVATTTAGTYALSETGGPSSYSLSSLTCSNSGTTQVNSVTIGLGDTVTCTFVNNDAPATPGFATDVDAQIRDNAKITGRGIPSGTVDFFLYGDSLCTEGVGSDLNVALNASGEATSKYFNITASDTYYWQVHYDGDANNAAATGSCGEAIKVESADFASVLTAGAGFVLPLVVWAVWSRRRRREDAI
jgi:hypothetical protein